MNTAERIFEEVQSLPEAYAREVLDFVGYLKSRQAMPAADRRQHALATLAKYRGRFKAARFNRDELYDRPCLR